MDLDDSELYWTRKKKGLATEKETEKETEEYIRSLESKLNKEKEKNKCLRDNINHSIRTSAIKEALGLEGDITEEELLNYIDILVSENNRLEDIEDKKVQIEYQNVFNKGVKSVEKKIQEKIKYAEHYIDSVDNDEGQAMYKILNELLQEIYKNLIIEVNFKDFRLYEIIIKIEYQGIQYESKIEYKYDANLTIDANLSTIVHIIDTQIIIPFFKRGE